MKEGRESGETGCGALTEVERDFVTEYVEAVGDHSAERIAHFLEVNADEFDGDPEPQSIVPAVRERL